MSTTSTKQAAAEKSAAKDADPDVANGSDVDPNASDVQIEDDGTPSTDAPGGVAGLVFTDASDTPNPDLAEYVRVVPAEWGVSSVEFDAEVEGETQTITVARPEGGAPGCVMTQDAADSLIAAAGARGLALTKESLA